jgi:hypothetical protein
VNVEPYSPELGKLANIPIGTACTCWNDPTTGKGYILSINECLYFGDRLQQLMLSPIQLRNHGLIVDDTPRQFNQTRTHSIYVPSAKIRIPLSMMGVISYFDSRVPTDVELNTLDRIELTSTTTWDPSSDHFTFFEQRYCHVLTSIKSDVVMLHNPILPLLTDVELEDDDCMLSQLIATVRISPRDTTGDGIRDDLDPDIYPHAENSGRQRKDHSPKTVNCRFNGRMTQPLGYPLDV